ncbi:MAG: hypothetical protein R2827_14360 [Bdellovibrionales bacterium]
MSRNRLFISILVCLMTMKAFGQSQQAGNEADPDFVIKAAARGLNPEVFTPESYPLLQAEVENYLSSLDPESDNSYVEDQIEVLEDVLDLLKTNENADHATRVMTYFNAFHAIYGLSADYELDNGKRPLIPKARIRFSAKVPHYAGEELTVPVGIEQAELEAWDLQLASGDRNRFLSTEELAEMNQLELSELDISDIHPAWFSQKDIHKSKNHLEGLRQWRQQRIRRKYHNRMAESLNRSRNEVAPPQYNLRDVQHVMFIDEMHDRATSPKMHVRDNYGSKWKLKFGAETHTEPIANCLAVKAGAKYADLVFAQPYGKEGVTLILDSPDKENGFATLTQLREALNDIYKFDILVHVADHGEITANNVNDILSQLIEDREYTRFKKSDLIGRQYVTFKSSMLEEKDGAGQTRIGPAAYNAVGATSGSRGPRLYDI